LLDYNSHELIFFKAQLRFLGLLNVPQPLSFVLQPIDGLGPGFKYVLVPHHGDHFVFGRLISLRFIFNIHITLGVKDWTILHDTLPGNSTRFGQFHQTAFELMVANLENCRLPVLADVHNPNFTTGDGTDIIPLLQGPLQFNRGPFRYLFVTFPTTNGEYREMGGDHVAGAVAR
jgi:hypothetical protein